MCCRSVRSRFSCASLEARSRGYISMGTQLMWVAEVTARPAPGLGGPGVASPPPRSPSAAVCGRMRRAAGMEVRTPGAWMLLADLDRTGEPVNSVTMRVTESDGALGAAALPAGRGDVTPRRAGAAGGDTLARGSTREGDEAGRCALCSCLTCSARCVPSTSRPTAGIAACSALTPARTNSGGNTPARALICDRSNALVSGRLRGRPELATDSNAPHDTRRPAVPCPTTTPRSDGSPELPASCGG